MSQEKTCIGVSLLTKLEACSFVKKGTLTQVFSSEFCDIFRNILWKNSIISTQWKRRTAPKYIALMQRVS